MVKRPAICHPTKERKTKDGLCGTCYAKVKRELPKATCHPVRPHMAKGLCSTCYNKKYPRPKELCIECESREQFSRRRCKNCYDKWLKKQNPEYAENQRQNCKEWIASNPDKYSEGQKKYRQENPKLAVAVVGTCSVCLSQDVRLDHDHDHETNEWRGWICRKCNLMLGLAHDNLETLTRAVDYLKNPPIKRYEEV